MIDRFTLWFARFALGLLGTRFSMKHRRVWTLRVDPYLKNLDGTDSSEWAARTALYFGDPNRVGRGLRPVFEIRYTDEMLDVFLEHVRTAREMRDGMRRG